MSFKPENDEIITISEDIEKGYFFLENRRFIGPFDRGDQAYMAARNQISEIEGQMRHAIYHGSVRINRDTLLTEPLGDMRQCELAEYEEAQQLSVG